MGFRNRRSPIGVELSKDAVRLVQVERTVEQAKVVAFAEIQRSGEDGDAEALAAEVRRAIRSKGFKGRKAVACLPPGDLILRHVKVRPSEGQALDDALLFELEDAFPGDAPFIQHVPVGEVLERGEHLNEFILMAAATGRIDELLKFLEASGLDPIAIDVEAGALVRCFMLRSRRSSDEDRHTAIVYVGPTATVMTITSAMKPLFMKQLPLGTKDLFTALRERLDLGPADFEDNEDDDPELRRHVASSLRLQVDSLASEVTACLRYHAASRRSPAGVRILLVGPGCAIPGFPEAVTEALGGEVSRPDPFASAFSGVTAPAALSLHHDAWSVPLGLALREGA